jgi:hypothetical protein
MTGRGTVPLFLLSHHIDAFMHANRKAPFSAAYLIEQAIRRVAFNTGRNKVTIDVGNNRCCEELDYDEMDRLNGPLKRGVRRKAL